MPSQEYHDGKSMEHNTVLFDLLADIFHFDSVTTNGSTSSKADIVCTANGTIVPVSVKYGSQVNTQVHLTTLASFRLATSMPDDVFDLMNRWLGTTSQAVFESWVNTTQPVKKLQQKYKRLFADDLDPDWKLVIDWFNSNSKAIAKLLIQALRDEIPVKYLVWINKKTRQVDIIDTEKLIDWIEKKCKWATGPKNGGSTIRCEQNDVAIFHLQMKGSGGTRGEYNHNPQFHLHRNWPSDAIVYSGKL